MRQQLLLWHPFRRYRQRWGLYLATPQRVLTTAQRLGLHRCEACGISNPKDRFDAFTDFTKQRVLIDVTRSEADIADAVMHELLHVARGAYVEEQPHDETFVRGASSPALFVFAEFGFCLPPFPERYAEFRAAALKQKRNPK